MPQGKSAYDLIVSSLRLGGMIAVGETPTADEANDALDTLNDILEVWSTEELAVWTTDNETFPLVAGQANYTIGPSGQFVTKRPVSISDAFCTTNTVNFTINIVGLQEFNTLSVPQTPGDIANWMCYVNDFPNGIIKLWPVPLNNGVTLTLNTMYQLATIPTLATVLVYPPGFYMAIRYTLTTALYPEYEKEPNPLVVQIATKSLASYKRANRQRKVLTYGPELNKDTSIAIYLRGY